MITPPLNRRVFLYLKFEKKGIFVNTVPSSNGRITGFELVDERSNRSGTANRGKEIGTSVSLGSSQSWFDSMTPDHCPISKGRPEDMMMAAKISEYLDKKAKIQEYLGGCCRKCGRDDNLEVDHIDHKAKEFNVMKNWGWAWERLVPELNKCQLLCKTCHLEKSINEGSLAEGWASQPRKVHGTVWTYTRHKCRCDPCRKAKSIESKKYYDRRKRSW